MRYYAQRLTYRLRYYRRKLLNFLGMCHRCYGAVNYTRHGKAVCPHCGK